jgi:hypothetical protein
MGAAVTGNVTVKVAPLFVPSLAARIVPPCISTRALQIRQAQAEAAELAGHVAPALFEGG